MNFVQFHVGDWEAGTRLLSPTEKGAYIDLLMLYYSLERPLMRSECDRISRAYAPNEKDALEYVLCRFFVEVNGSYSHKRCDAEIRSCREKSQKASESAKARWNKRSEQTKRSSAHANSIQNECESDASAKRTQCERMCERNTDAMLTNNHKPITNNHKEEKKETKKKSAAPKAPKAAPVEKPDDVSDQVWTEWLALRKAKRAQVTPFILDRIRKQAERVPAKYGFTFEDALLMMIDAQWTGFEAEWVVNRLSRTGGRATAAPQGFTRELSAEERARNPGFGITQEDIDEALTPLTPEEIAALSPHQDDVPPFDEALTLH